MMAAAFGIQIGIGTEIEDKLNAILESITLKTVVQRSKDHAGKGILNYEI